jgi:large subunit ribosomal protein L15
MENFILKAPKGAKKKKKMVGRGIGCGHGATSGRGEKGQGSRSGGSVRPGFEGGQMPLYRRIARRGFSNYPFKKIYEVINIEELNIYEDGTTVTKSDLVKKGILKHPNLPTKLLGQGELKKKLKINVDKVSKSAKIKIEQSGGEVVETHKKEESKNQ